MKACLPQSHPLEPFFPQGAKLLMLGSFPPKTNRWSMEFFYPNFQNDMWRIFGLLYYSNPLHFAIAGKKAFDKDKLIEFLSARRIALYDTAVSVVRLKDNASDAFFGHKRNRWNRLRHGATSRMYGNRNNREKSLPSISFHHKCKRTPNGRKHPSQNRQKENQLL